MRGIVLLAAVLVSACGAATGRSSTGTGSSTGLVTGDTCELHQDATTCQADLQGCSWYLNTRPCLVGQPCPAGWCYLPQQNDGGPASSGSGSASAACACSDGSDEVCVIQIGGPAIPAPSPPPTCVALGSNCTAKDHCACLAQGPIERCWASEQVTNLCVCDDGIR